MNTTVQCMNYHVKPNKENVIADGPCTILFASIGLIGNMYGLRQLSFLQLGKDFQIYLRTLSLWDMSVLSCAFIQYGLLNMVFLLSADLYHLPLWSYLARIFQGPLVTALTGSCWTTVAIAFMRYMAIARPTAQMDKNSNRTVGVCVLISLAAVFYCLPVHLEITIRDCFDHVTGRNEVQVWPRLFAIDSYRIFYRSYAYLVFVSVGPFVAILGLSVRTLVLLRRSIQRTRSRTARSVSRQRKMAILFSVLLLKFIVCNFAATGVFLLSVVGTRLLNRLPMFTQSFCNFTSLLHNATNFLLYLPWYKSQNNNRKYKTDDTSKPDQKSSVTALDAHAVMPIRASLPVDFYEKQPLFQPTKMGPNEYHGQTMLELPDDIIL